MQKVVKIDSVYSDSEQNVSVHSYYFNIELPQTIHAVQNPIVEKVTTSGLEIYIFVIHDSGRMSHNPIAYTFPW